MQPCTCRPTRAQHLVMHAQNEMLRQPLNVRGRQACIWCRPQALAHEQVPERSNRPAVPATNARQSLPTRQLFFAVAAVFAMGAAAAAAGSASSAPAASGGNSPDTVLANSSLLSAAEWSAAGCSVAGAADVCASDGGETDASGDVAAGPACPAASPPAPSSMAAVCCAGARGKWVALPCMP